LAVFAALAYVVHFIHIPVSFLNLDFKDVIMTVAGMYFGPISGVVVAILVPLLEFPTSETGIYGLIMNLISSVTFVGVASLIYRFKRTLTGAIVALVAAAMSMTAIMMVANLFITPLYMGVSREAVVSLIPSMLLPFNAVKSILNASLTLCVYKPMTNILRRVGVAKAVVSTEKSPANDNTKLRSVLVVTIGGIVAAVSLAIIFFVLGGTISFG
jgi:riboflavin transporter FmnP